MSDSESTLIRDHYQVDAPPNDLTLGVVLCEAYHRETRVMDKNAKLFILHDGSFNLFTSEGVFPVNGWYFTKTATVIESDKTTIVDNAINVDPDFHTELVEIGISRKAWNLACNFATDLLLVRVFDPEATFDMPYVDCGPTPTPIPPAPPLPTIGRTNAPRLVVAETAVG